MLDSLPSFFVPSLSYLPSPQDKFTHKVSVQSLYASKSLKLSGWMKASRSLCLLVTLQTHPV